MSNIRISPALGTRAGAIPRGCAIALGAVVLALLVLAGILVSGYNGMVSGQELVSQRWAQVENTYKRRNDLIPNLVNTVQGAKEFEQETLTEITELRASVGKMQMPDELPTDQAQLNAYLKAQQSLGGAVGRLLLVAENYPTLKATDAFRDLQVQLEGTENRITVARTDYTEAVRDFNTSIRTFPRVMFAAAFGFEKLPQFTVEEEEKAVPVVDFGE
jgi:LemA protein